MIYSLLKETNNYNLRHKLFSSITRNKTVRDGFESKSYLGPKIWETMPSEMQECETLFEFESKVKSWNPINWPCKLCKTYIGGIGYIWIIEQYTPRDKPYELIRNVGLFYIKKNLLSRFSLMLNIPILSESFCLVFYAAVCKLLIVFIKFLCEVRQKKSYFLSN